MRASSFALLLALPALAACGGTDSVLFDAGGSDDATVDRTPPADDSGPAPSDAGPGPDGATTDGGRPDGATGPDGGSNPGLIDCASTTCTAGQQVCCTVPPDGGSIVPDAGIVRVCATPQQCQGPQKRCDEKADCPMNQVCCFNGNGGASLATRCDTLCGPSVQVCKTNQECGAMGACGTYDCGVLGTVRACTKPTGCN